MPPGSFVLRLCSTLTFVPYFSLDPALSEKRSEAPRESQKK